MARTAHPTPEDRSGDMTPNPSPDRATEAFLAHRNLLFTIAYEMLGSAADAEDVVQETWLRWSGVDLDTVRDQRAYLARMTTRQALARLRALGRRKESYVGTWLPEPLLTAPDVADDVELADSISMAMLLVLESLTPTERAVFVLREVFEFGYGEIADAVGRTAAAVRQIAHRAREHVTARRPRGTASAAEARAALEAFQQAVQTGEVQPLLDILAPDVVFLADGGGVVPAAPAPVEGVDQAAEVLRRIAASSSQQEVRAQGYLAQVNGHPALILERDGAVETVVTVRLDGGLITGLYAVRNPEKLSRLGRETTLRR